MTASVDTMARIKPHLDSTYGPGYTETIRRELEAFTTENAKNLYLDFISSPGDNHARRDEITTLADTLGYTSSAQTAEVPLGTLIRHQLRPERLPHLIKHLGSAGDWNHRWVTHGQWDAEGMEKATPEALDAAFAATANVYTALAIAADPSREYRIRACVDLGVKDIILIESMIDPELLADLTDAAGIRTMPHAVIELAKGGFTGAKVRAYGPIACQRYGLQQLSGAKHAGAIRSLTSAFPSTFPPAPTLEDLQALIKAGYTSRALVYRICDNFGLERNRVESIPDLITVAAHVTATEVESLRFIHRGKLSVEEALACRILIDAGLNSMEAVTDYTSRVHLRSQHGEARQQSTLSLLAAVVEAGISPECFGQLSRAGIPISVMPSVDRRDVWAAGRRYRRQVQAAEERSFEQGFSRQEPRPWEFTERTFEQEVPSCTS